MELGCHGRKNEEEMTRDEKYSHEIFLFFFESVREFRYWRSLCSYMKFNRRKRRKDIPDLCVYPIKKSRELAFTPSLLLRKSASSVAGGLLSIIVGIDSPEALAAEVRYISESTESLNVRKYRCIHRFR